MVDIRDFGALPDGKTLGTQAIQKAIAEQTNTVRLPINRSQQAQKIKRLSQRLEQKHLRPVYQQEIADGLGLELRKMQQIQAASRPLVSIDQPLYDDDVTLADTLCDQDVNTADQDYVDDELVKELGEAMSLLTPREKDIVSRYYGKRCPSRAGSGGSWPHPAP